MSTSQVTPELSALTEEVIGLKAKLSALEARVVTLEESGVRGLSPEQASGVRNEPQSVNSMDTISNLSRDKLMSLGTSALLPRIAAVCFILVFALILRTLTNSEVVGQKLGSFIGIGYAAALIGWGWFLLHKGSKLAKVFPICGLWLMYSIGIESTHNFGTISQSTMFFILTGMMVAISIMSSRYALNNLNGLVIIVTGIVALIIGFPEPTFPGLMLLLLVGNVLAYLVAKETGKGEFARFFNFFITTVIWLFWAVRLRVALGSDEPVKAYLAEAWFLPILLIFALTCVAMTVWQGIKQEKMSFFDTMIPAMNALWAYGLALSVVKAGAGSTILLGFVGLMLAIGHFWFAAYSFKQHGRESNCIGAFSYGGGMLLLFSLPSAFGTLVGVPLIVAFAFSQVKISAIHKIAGVRYFAYILLGMAALIGLLSGAFMASTAHPLLAILAAATVAVVSGFQYRWCRTTPYHYATFDKKDKGAMIALAAFLLYSFCFLNLLISQVVFLIAGEASTALAGIQSLLLNFGAIALLFLARRTRNREILGMGLALIFLGAIKVCFDLVNSEGMNVVLSVLSFGGVAAAASFVLGKWSQETEVASGAEKVEEAAEKTV